MNGALSFIIQQKKKKVYYPNDEESQQFADVYAAEAVSLMKSAQTDYAIMGGDMNNNPGNYAPTFELIEKSNFTVLEPDTETNVNRFEEDYKFRKIDFIFTLNKSLLKRIAQAISSFFRSTTVITTSQPQVVPGFDFTVEDNCSDHKPVKAIIMIQQQESTLSKLWHRIFK